MGIFSDAKDRMIEGMALSYLNTSLLTPYGRATALKIDTAAKNLRIELDLKGEAAPVQLEILGYELTQKDGRYFASAREIRTSREWLTRVARDRVANQQFEIPSHVGTMLARCL